MEAEEHKYMEFKVTDAKTGQFLFERSYVVNPKTMTAFVPYNHPGNTAAVKLRRQYLITGPWVGQAEVVIKGSAIKCKIESL